MDTTELIHTLKTNKCTRNWFKGCFAADKLPKTFKKPGLFVVNTQEAQLSGEHWVSIYIAENGICEFFDSFGQPPSVSHHIKFIKKHCTKSCIYNNISIQGPFSSKCGQFSSSFLLFKARGKSMRTFLKLFSHADHMSNDRIIDEIFNVNFKSYNYKGKNKYKINCNQIG